MSINLTPSSDGDSFGIWQDQDGGVTNLYQAIDDLENPIDSDYVWRDNASVGDYIEFPISNPSGIHTEGNAVIRWRASDADGTTTLSVELRQGSTVIAVDSRNLAVSLTDYEYILHNLEMENVSDWNNLRLRMAVRDPRDISTGPSRTLSDGRVRTVS